MFLFGVSLASLSSVLLAVLHAAKYFDCHVGGYLVGTVVEEEASADRNRTVNISDVIPLVHGYPVGPIFDIGADLLNGDSSIVGYYYSNEAVDETKIPSYIEALRAANSSLIVVRLNAGNLLDKTKKVCFENDKINISTVSGESVDAISSSISGLLSSNRHQQLSDVEELLSSSTDIAVLRRYNDDLTKDISR